jgi:ankyrin repeat protein
MSDAIPLPPRPLLDSYKKLAQELLRASTSVSEDAIRAWALRWLERQLRLRGEEPSPEAPVRIAREADAIEQRWLRLRKKRNTEECSLADAQFFLAREHGFLSWPKFAEHVGSLENAQSPVAYFEAAADAIVAGDEEKLGILLASDPSLVRARSTRQHRSTLLHYCSANGVEDYRQKTPGNIVAITRRLLDAGAEVNAESDAYGGRSTTLMLAATSVHPEHAGVQIALLELLLERGAVIDLPGTASMVNVCLRNGRRLAAEFLAGQGGELDLEGAAGVGRLGVVATFFDGDGALRAPATPQQLSDGFGWACEFGHAEVARFLMQKGMRACVQLRPEGETALHYAALGGQAEVVLLLLAHGADVHARERRFNATPLGWALHGWSHRAPKDDGRRYCEVVNALMKAGAPAAVLQIQIRDQHMLAALRGEYAINSSGE